MLTCMISMHVNPVTDAVTNEDLQIAERDRNCKIVSFDWTFKRLVVGEASVLVCSDRVISAKMHTVKRICLSMSERKY